MKKTVCDICEKDMSAERQAEIKDMNFCISTYGRAWDICNECRDALNKWMKERKIKVERDDRAAVYYSDGEGGFIYKDDKPWVKKECEE